MALETIDQALARREQPKQENVIEVPADDEPADVNVEPKSREEFLNAIYLAHSNILRAKLKLRTAKENREDLVGDLEEKQDLDDLKSQVRSARDKLAISESPAVRSADEELEAAVADLGLAQKVMSDLLVVYSAKFNSRTVDVDERRLIVLTAKLGKVEVEQLSLF